MFTECGENLGPEQVEVYCEELSPPTNDSCIPLNTFIDKHEPGTCVFDLFTCIRIIVRCPYVETLAPIICDAFLPYRKFSLSRIKLQF